MPTFDNAIDWSTPAQTYALIHGELERAKQDKIENQQRAQSEADNHAIIEAQLHDYTLKSQQYQTDVDTQNRVNAFRAGLNFPKNYGQMSPEQQASYLDSLAIQSLQHGDENGAKILQGLSSSIPRGQEQFAQAGLNQAKRRLTEAEIPNVVHLFDHQIQMQKLRISGAERTAAIRAMHAAARGGTDPTNKAYQQALAAINDGTVRAAVQSSIDQYQDANRAYQAAGDDSQPPPQYQAPNFTINTTVLPNGQTVPIIVPAHPNTGGGGNKNTGGGGNNTGQKSGGGTPWYEGGPITDAIKGAIQKFSGGGGSTQRIVQKNNQTGQYRHSDDGGKTWQPGPG